MTSRKTRFSDVCGSMDELKRLVHEEHARVAADPEAVLSPLLEDADFMLGRMKERLNEYERFRESVRELLAHLDAVPDVDLDKAREAMSAIRELARSADVARIDALAEDIRSAASAQEHCLRSHKDGALKLHERFAEIKGSRPWTTEPGDAESAIETLKRRHQAWLPPEPHRAALFERFSQGLAHVSDESWPDGQPVVQFQDGGSIPMSQIRWDAHIRNFHDASFKPAPTARDYRRTSPPQRRGRSRRMKRKALTDLRIIKHDNPPILRSRYGFEYAPVASAGLKKFRTRYRLDKVVGKTGPDFRQIMRVRDWVCSRFDHGFANRTKWETNALAYLRRAEDGENFTCAVFAFVLVEALAAVGIPARNLTIAKDHPDFNPAYGYALGHCVAEVWSNQFRKWLVLDADTASHYERDGIPLNALEIRQAWLDGTWKQVRFVRGKHIPPIRPAGYPGPIAQMHRNTKTYFEHNITNYYHNVEFQMGNHHYRRGGPPPRRLVWADEHRLPQIVRRNIAVDPSFRVTTSLRSDIYYTLNHAFIALHCPPRAGGKPVPLLDVALDTETPWFDHYEVRIDGAKWRKRPARFTWKLHDGHNTLRARPVNKHGRNGITTQITVRCKMAP